MPKTQECTGGSVLLIESFLVPSVMSRQCSLTSTMLRDGLDDMSTPITVPITFTDTMTAIQRQRVVNALHTAQSMLLAGLFERYAHAATVDRQSYLHRYGMPCNGQSVDDIPSVNVHMNVVCFRCAQDAVNGPVECDNAIGAGVCIECIAVCVGGCVRVGDVLWMGVSTGHKHGHIIHTP